MSQGYFGKREKLDITDLHHYLITASHILHSKGVLDAYGHVSVRNPDNPKATFWLPQNLAPGLLSTVEDLVEYKIEDGEPAERDEQRPAYLERFLHSEVYKKFPGVNCVVHCHCPAVLPYCTGPVPLKPMSHMCGFLSPAVPVWQYPNSAPHDFLVRDTNLGHHFAAAFKPATSAGFLMDAVKSALPASLSGSGSQQSAEAANLPDYPVVLMRGHGMSVASASLEEAVFMAVYAREAALLQTTSMQNALAWSLLQGKTTVEGSVPGGEHGGKIRNGRLGMEWSSGGMKFLGTKEADECWATMRNTVQRAWRLWCREVEVNPLYRNEVSLEES